MNSKKLNSLKLNAFLFLGIVLMMNIYTIGVAQDNDQPDSLVMKASVAHDYDVVLTNLVFNVQDILSSEYWGRNPFLPYANLRGGEVVQLNDVQADKNNRVFILEKILWKNGGKRAVINHHKIALGDTLKGHSINYIGVKVVILKSINDYVVLSLNE